VDEIEFGMADPAYLPDLGTQVYGIVHWFLVGFQLLATGLSRLLFVAYGQYPAVFWGTVNLVLTWWPLLVGGVVVGAIFGVSGGRGTASTPSKRRSNSRFAASARTSILPPGWRSGRW